jgi:cation-transporting P-type ATPase 13A2
MISSESPYDYTEGATPEDIEHALLNGRRSRRASQLSMPYGEDGVGAVFDGPGHAGVPSSASRMPQFEQGRRGSNVWSTSRRNSQDSQSRDGTRHGKRAVRRTDTGGSYNSVDTIEDDALSDNGHRYSPASPERSPPPAKPSVFENLASMFGRHSFAESPSPSRRQSFSQISTATRRVRRHRDSYSQADSDIGIDDEGSGDDRWGYSSGEDDDDVSLPSISDVESATRSASDRDSYPPSPGPTLPLLSTDPMFAGETRIDIATDFEPLDPPPPGLPSRQTIYIADEDVNIRFVGYEVHHIRQGLWKMSCILTFGIFALLGHWFPRLWLRWVAHEKAFKDIKDGFVVAEVRFRAALHDFIVQLVGRPPSETLHYFL